MTAAAPSSQSLLAGLLGIGVIAYLGLASTATDQVAGWTTGIVVWWILVLAAALGAVGIGSLGASGRLGFGALGGLALWTVASLLWTESAAATWNEVGRNIAYLGIFGAGLAARSRTRSAAGLLGGVAAGLTLIALVALASRFFPTWFAATGATAVLGEAFERLSYPIGYWNALGAVGVMAIPLVLAIAVSARAAATRAAATAGVPLLVLMGYLTFSRAVIPIAVLGVLVFLVLTRDRVAALFTIAFGALGAAILVVGASASPALVDGQRTAEASSQGLRLLALAAVVTAVGGVLHRRIAPTVRRRFSGARLELPSVRGGRLAAVLAGLAVVAVVVFVGADVPGSASRALTQFQDPVLGVSSEAAPRERLDRLGGNGRYQFWSVALEQGASAPVVGTGAGTYRYRWLRERPIDAFVQNAHSLYLESFAELGLVGLALSLGLVFMILVHGVRRTLATEGSERVLLAGATAACTVFALWAAIDWVWQVAAVPGAFLLTAAALVGRAGDEVDGPPPRPASRIAVATVGLVAMALIGVPLVSDTQLGSSRTNADAGRLDAALTDARQTVAVQPASAPARLQEALVLEARGELVSAVLAARKATDLEPGNWQNWLILARLEAATGDERAADRARGMARMNNPLSPVFASGE